MNWTTAKRAERGLGSSRDFLRFSIYRDTKKGNSFYKLFIYIPQPLGKEWLKLCGDSHSPIHAEMQFSDDGMACLMRSYGSRDCRRLFYREGGGYLYLCRVTGDVAKKWPSKCHTITLLQDVRVDGDRLIFRLPKCK
jgi:hypothetical protein